VIVDAVAGVQAQTRTVWRQCQKQNLPAVAFVNKMDREGACMQRAVQSLRSKLNINVIPVQFPIGQESDFEGAVDLIGMKRLMFPGGGSSGSRTPQPPVISDLAAGDPLYGAARQARREMMESIAEVDEEFMDLYLSREEREEGGEEVSVGEEAAFTEAILGALRRACRSGVAVPLMCGSALKGKGVEPLLDALTCFLPSPCDRPPIELNPADGNGTLSQMTLSPEDASPMVALAFKLVYDKSRGGTLAFVRIYSGRLQAKDVLHNSSKDKRERVNQLFKISADELVPIASVGAGDIACIVGTKFTVTGDTIVIDKSAVHSYVLSGLTIPDAVFSLSVEPATSSQQADLEKALEMMCLEDPSLRVEVSSESGQTLLKGIGELHLDIVCDRLHRQYGIQVTTGKAYVAYREGIDPDMGEFKEVFAYDKQIGTKRLFAVLDAVVTPMPPAAGGAGANTAASTFAVSDEVRKALSAAQLHGLESGLKVALSRGPWGYPVVGLDVYIRRVKFDADSTPGALQASASALLSRLLRESGHGVVLEPVMLFEAEVPDATTGDVLGDLAAGRRAVVKEVVPSSDGTRNAIFAHVPLAPMLGYATAIRSATKGEGSFSMEYLGHQKVVDDSFLLN
jgi:elongation factor G